MDYVFAKMIWYLLVALALGVAVGWYTCGRGDAGES